MKFSQVLFFFLTLALYATPTLADAISCQAMTEAEVVQHGEKLTTLLRIANFRADLNGMETHLGNLETFIASCTGAKKHLSCGTACYYEQANVFLFKASDLPYLSSSSGRNQVARLNIPAADAMRFVNEGIRRIEAGLRGVVKRRGTVQASVPEGPSSAFKDFINNSAMLGSMLIRLKMTAGDLWYQQLSQARLQHLDTVVTHATNRPPVDDGACVSGSELCTARAYYEDALWGLIEAKSDVAAQLEFAATQNLLTGLETDLRTRLNSIRRGHLFLDLDPERFTSIPSTELLDVLSDMQAKLAELEGKIEGLVQSWAMEKGNQAQAKIDDNRYFDGQKSALISHKIAKLDTESQKFTNALEKGLNQLNFDNEDWEYRRMLRTMQADLEQKRLETEAQKKLVTNRKSGELLAVRQDEIVDQRSELRWLINARLTQNSLEMQIGAFESQRLEYQSRIKANQIKANQVQERINQARLSQNIAKKEKTMSKGRQDQIKAERTTIFQSSKKAMSVGICGIETSLAFIGEKPAKPLEDESEKPVCAIPPIAYTRASYQDAICNPITGLRHWMASDRLQAAIFTRKCVVGITTPPPDADEGIAKRHNDLTCPSSLPGEYKIAKDIAEAEKAVRDGNAANLKDRLAEMKQYVADLKSATASFETWDNDLLATLKVAELALSLAEETPTMVLHTFAAGLASGTGTSTAPADDKKDRQRSVYLIAKQAYDIGKDKLKFNLEKKRLFGELQTRVKDLENQINSIDVETTLAEAEAGRVIAQLMGRETVQNQDIVAAHLQSLAVIQDCNGSANQLDSEVDRLKSEHERQSAMLNAETLRIASQQHAEDIEGTRAESAELQDQIHQSQEAELVLELQQIKQDNETLQALDNAVASRIESTKGVKSEVEQLDSQSRALNQFLAELRTERSRLAMAVDETEQQRLDQLLQKQETQVDTERKAILERLANSNLELSLKNRLKDTQNQFVTEIGSLRDELIAGVQKEIETGPNQRETSFLVTAEQLTDMLAGVPEYVRAKKALIGSVNTTMSHLRSRFKILAGLGGDAADLLDIPYIRTSGELTTVMQSFCRRGSGGTRCMPQSNAPFYDERQVETFSETFVLPGSSGLAQALVRDGEVRFRVAPLAGSSAEQIQRLMEEQGYFTLWATRLNQQRNMVLTDVIVGIDYPCTTVSGDRINVTHLGDGMLFRSLSADTPNTVVPVFMSDAPRSWSVGVFDLKNGEVSKYNERVMSWKGDFQMRSFPETRKNPDSSDAPLPFLGAPLLATYKLSLMQGSCSVAGAPIKITFAYAGKAK